MSRAIPEERVNALRLAWFLTVSTGLSSSATEARPDSVSSPNPSEIVVTHSSPAAVHVDPNAASRPQQDLQVEVLPNEISPSIAPSNIQTPSTNSLGKIVDPTPEASLHESNSLPSSMAGSANPASDWEIDQRELAKWRRLSKYPIHLTLENGVLTIEWAGVQKSSPMTNHQEILLQLDPP